MYVMGDPPIRAQLANGGQTPCQTLPGPHSLLTDVYDGKRALEAGRRWRHLHGGRPGAG